MIDTRQLRVLALQRFFNLISHKCHDDKVNYNNKVILPLSGITAVSEKNEFYR